MSRPPRGVVLVVDTGVDDALALLCAVRDPRLRLEGVVATAGNVSLPRAVANTRHVLRLLEATVPLGRGADRRSDGRPFPARPSHGPDGLAGLGPADEPGSQGLALLPTAADVLACAPGATVVSLGPLTALLAVDPRPAVAACAQPGGANEAMDPDAARAVRARWPVVDDDPTAFAACRVPVLPTRARTAPARLALTLLRHQADRGAGLGDAGAVLRLAGSRAEGADLRRLLEGLDSRRPRD